MSNKNIEKKYTNPEIERRSKKSTVKLGNYALGAVVAFAVLTGFSKMLGGGIDYDKDGNSYIPNGNVIPSTYFDIKEFSEGQDLAGKPTYENPKGVTINFELLEENKALMIEKGGSFRTSPISADIERVSTILLSEQDLVLNDVDEVGRYKSPRGDDYYMIERNQAPEDVQEYIDKKDIQVPNIDGKDYIFINENDVKVIEAVPSVVSDDSSLSLAVG